MRIQVQANKFIEEKSKGKEYKIYTKCNYLTIKLSQNRDVRIQVKANDKVLKKEKKIMERIQILYQMKLSYNRAISKQRCENPSTSNQ